MVIGMTNHYKPNISRELAEIREKIQQLDMPTPSYAAVGMIDDEYIVSVIDADKVVTLAEGEGGLDSETAVIDWLRSHANKHHTKIIAAALLGGSRGEGLGSRLWLEKDIVPHLMESDEPITKEMVRQAANDISFLYDEKTIPEVGVDETRQVIPSFLVTLKDYQQTASPALWSKLTTQAERFRQQNNSMVFINATARGGGVALMRHALIRLARLMKVDLRWHVLQPNSTVFEITKTKFHNVLQEVAPDGIELTDHDQDVYNSWIAENFERLQEPLERAAVVVIDDPQPSGLIPLIKNHWPNKPILYRSHIHLNRETLADPTTQANRTWQFLWGNIQQAQAFIHHPVSAFVPEETDGKALAMPATTDALDGLNKPLNDTQIGYYISWFNKNLYEHDQPPLDLERPYFIQVARFDPSKGISDAIESYHLLRQKLRPADPVPQLVLVGHGSIDDPDGVPVYNLTMHSLREDRYVYLADDVKVARLPHSDQILNALLRRSLAALQLSIKEGFEIKVTEALQKGKPVIAYRTGGIPLQVKDGENGFLLERGQCQEVAVKMYELLTNDVLYEQMSVAALKTLNEELFTVQNLVNWLYLANEAQSGRQLPNQSASVAGLIL